MGSSEIIRYYESTGLDYGSWSREFNMHFGYWRWGMNPFDREPMLEAMNRLMLETLQLSPESLVFDLGCGLGATMRSLAHLYASPKVIGVTLVPWQVEQARALNAAFGQRLEIWQEDYTRVPTPDASADAAYALESCCHSRGEDKAEFLAELYRLLKPGARFAIVDGFTKQPRRPPILQGWIDTACQGWALTCFPCLGPFRQRLEELGFRDLQVVDLSWRIAPSVFHSPFCVVGFMLSKLRQGEKLDAVRLGHLKACFLSLLIGAFRPHFGYYLVTGVKPAP